MRRTGWAAGIGTPDASLQRMRKTSLAIVAGGHAAERRLSLESAHALADSLVGSRFAPSCIDLAEPGHVEHASLLALARFDYLLPLVHGAAIASVARLLGVPVLGNTETAVAAAVDKPIAKRLLAEAGLPVADGRTFTRMQIAARPHAIVARVGEEIGFPCVVKPASTSGSAGVGIAREPRELLAALVRAATWDARVVVEPFFDAREIEVEVIAGAPSRPAELVFRSELLDHETRVTPGAIEIVLPAMLAAPERDRLEAMAAAACAALGIDGVGRVEFLLDRNTHELLVNEVNPFPAFGPSSVFARILEADGMPAEQVVERLAADADTHAREEYRTRRELVREA